MTIGLHCWAVGPREHDGMSTFCRRERGHAGLCAFVRDHEARVGAAAEDCAAAREERPRRRRLDLSSRIRGLFGGGD